LNALWPKTKPTGHHGPMDGRYDTLRRDHEALCLEFISTELDLAVTFCEMAIFADDPHKAKRNANNARRAFAAAVHRFEAPTTGSKSTPEIDEKFRRLERLFAELETIPHLGALTRD
jgi:hypothetical protein